MKEYDFVNEWMNHASGGDLFFKFFCYYLAFNHLYDTKELLRPEERRKIDNGAKLTDLERIVSFLRHVLIDEDGPRLSVSVQPEEKQILDTVHWKNRRDKWVEDNPPELDWLRELARTAPNSKWPTVLALTKVYRVRCNLFHGEKHITNLDDKKKVSVSTGLLERFLQACVVAHLGIEHLAYND